MPGVEERLDKVEERLGSVEGRLGSVEERLGSVESGVNELRGDVQKLRVLGEQTASDLKLVSEVQGHHSARLAEITKALEPLARIDNFIKLVADDHEFRIQATRETHRHLRPGA
jgi:archaellum component FlaC